MGTQKEQAAEALRKAGIKADSADSVVMVHASVDDRDIRSRVLEIFKKIGYNASWGITGKGINSAPPPEAVPSISVPAPDEVNVEIGDDGQIVFAF